MTGREWFRLYAEFSTDVKVQALSEAMQRRLIMLFCMQCKGEIETLPEGRRDGYIALALRISAKEAEATRQELEAGGFVSDKWEIVNWAKRQTDPASMTNGAQRSARYRAKKKAERDENVTRDVTRNARRDVTKRDENVTRDVTNFEADQSGAYSDRVCALEDLSLVIDQESKSKNKRSFVGQLEAVTLGVTPEASKTGSNPHLPGELIPAGGTAPKSLSVAVRDAATEDAQAVIAEMNTILGSRYPAKADGQTCKAIRARMAEGITSQDLKLIIEFKQCEWGGDPAMAQYLRPSTLFRESNAHGYLQAARLWDSNGRKPKPPRAATSAELNASLNSTAWADVPADQWW